jgi:hypothetical protein
MLDFYGETEVLTFRRGSATILTDIFCSPDKVFVFVQLLFQKTDVLKRAEMSFMLSTRAFHRSF